MTQSTILEDVLLMESGKNSDKGNFRSWDIGYFTTFSEIYMEIYMLNFYLNFHCVIIHRDIDTGIEYFLEKIMNFDIFCWDNKSRVPCECDPWLCGEFVHGVVETVSDKCLENLPKSLYIVSSDL